MIVRLIQRSVLVNNLSRNYPFSVTVSRNENPFSGLTIVELKKLLSSTEKKTGNFFVYIIQAIEFKESGKKDFLRRDLKRSEEENYLVNRCLK